VLAQRALRAPDRLRDGGLSTDDAQRTLDIMFRTLEVMENHERSLRELLRNGRGGHGLNLSLNFPLRRNGCVRVAPGGHNLQLSGASQFEPQGP
jgi:hypothetical protein